MPCHVKRSIEAGQHAACIMMLVLATQVAPNCAIRQAHEHAMFTFSIQPVDNTVPVRKATAEHLFAMQAHPKLRSIVTNRACLRLKGVCPAKSVRRELGAVRACCRDRRPWVRLDGCLRGRCRYCCSALVFRTTRNVVCRPGSRRAPGRRFLHSTIVTIGAYTLICSDAGCTATLAIETTTTVALSLTFAALL